MYEVAFKIILLKTYFYYTYFDSNKQKEWKNKTISSYRMHVFVLKEVTGLRFFS